MKNIIERIAGGGAKIARYLPKVVSTRLAVAALAALAAGGAWAADSLEETGGALSAVGTDTLAFKGVTLSELTAETLHGRMSGDWAGTAATKSFTFNNFDRSNEGSGYITCQAQLVDDGWLKGMVLKFTQSGDDINAQIVSAGSINGGSIGGSVAGADNANSHYVIYNLSLTRSWSDSAVVIWEAGQFGVLSKTGSDGNTYTLDLNGNASDGSTITIDQSVGVKVDFPSAKTSGVTVLFRYSDLTPSGEKALVFSTNSQDANRTGVYLNSTTAGQPTGIWNTTGDYTTTQNRNIMTSALSAGVFAFQYREGTGDTDSNGTSLYVLTNGVRYAIYTATGLKTDSNSYGVSGCTLGGMRTKTSATLKNAATGMKITGIAVFDGILSESQMTSFVWPSAAAAEYAKWNYAAAGRVVTWKSLPDASLDSGTGQKITVAGTTYGVFDTYSGSDTGTYTGGATSNSGAYWNYFCIGKSVYSAPGSVMRFVASNTYAHNIRADYSPLTIGGIIVESGATGYTIAEDASNARKDNRAVILGDQPASGRETWFRFNEDFTFGRQGALAFVGSVNIEVAAGKTMTITAKANNSSETFVPKVCSSVAVNSDGSGALSTLTAGGTLRLHGLGKIASTAGLDASSATLDYADLPATSSTSAGAFIQGMLTVNSSTIIALPADATFPYYIATGISGSIDSDSGVTIGGVVSPNYVAVSDGSIVYSAPSEVTISADATWGTGVLDGWTTDDSTKSYVINVTANSTLTLPSTISLNSLTFNVDEGVTLTLSGAYTITAASSIHVNGLGKVITAAAGSFSGIIKGNGTVQYPSKTLPTTGAIWTNNDWEGTLIIVQCGKTNNSSHGYIDFASYGSVNSFIKATLFAGYTKQSTTANATYCAATLVIDEGDTFTLNNGDGSKSCVFKALTGSGTLALSGTGTATTQYIFRDVSGFTGTVTISDDAKKSIVLGASSSWTPNFSDYQKKLVIAGDVTIASGKTWTAGGGIVVAASGSLTVAGTAASAITDNGTLTLGDAAIVSGAISGSGEVVCTVLPDNAGLADSSDWTGTVTVKSEAYNPLSGLTEHTSTSFMNANSRLHAVLGDGVSVGFVQLMSASGLIGLVDIDQNVTLYINDTTSSSISFIAGDVNGSVSMDSCTATMLNLTLGSARPYITYPTTLTTLNISATETLADDGVYTQTVTGLSSLTTTTMTLTKLDGTVENLTGTVEGSTLTFSWTPTVSGAACWVDYEMNGSNANTGTEGTAFSYDGSYTAENSFYDSKFLYTYTHPYRDNLDAYPDSWTAVVRCTVPNLANAAIITFGNQTSGLIGLIAGDNPGSEMKLIQTTGNSAYSTKATMTVQDATSAHHVYVFAVENKRTLKCWCDGEQVLNEKLAADVSIGNGFQIGSVVYGVGNTGIVRWWPGDTAFDNLDADVKAAARIDCLRLYKGVLGPNAIAQLSVEFPAVKLFQATIDGGDAKVWDSLSWTGGDIGTLNEYSKIILTVTDDATLTLPSTVTAEEFTINVTAGKTLTLLQAAGGTTFSLTNPIEVNNGSLQFPDDATIDFAINGTGTVRVDDGETLNLVDGGSVPGLTGAGTLDCSSMSALPGAFTFTGWTGTVSLPSFSASSGVNFNNYGATGSTVVLAGMTGGYILQAGATVAPTLQLNGNMVINAMSSWTYTFAEITGSGNLSFSTSANTPTVAITKVAEGYSGTISSTLETPVTIATLDRAVETSTAGGTKLLLTSGNVAASALTVGGAAQQVRLCTAADGIYVACTVTIPDVENASATVTVGGVAATGSSPYTVDVGSNVEITWTADSGYKITAGAMQTINAIATDVTATAPMVEAKGATVSDVAFDYGKDFATATVTATVSGDATAYTLTVDGTDYPGTVDGTTVTFSNVVTGHSSAYDSVSYEIAATDGTSSVVVSGGSGSAVVADGTPWIWSSVSDTTPVISNGKWVSTSGSVTYADSRMSFEGTNTFAATCVTTGDIVRIEAKGVVFNGENDELISKSAQGAVKIASDGNGGYVFKVLTAISGNVETWEGASEVTPTESGSYDVVVTFYYTDTPYYTVSVNGTLLSIASGVGNDTTTHIPNAQSGMKSLSGVGVLGSGSMTSLVGTELEGNMVIDNNGVKYATIAAAVQAYTANSNIGPLTMLHSGTAPDGWEIDENNQLVRAGVAKIGDVLYQTLQEALDVGGEVELIQDVTTNGAFVVAADKEVTLNLAGKTVIVTGTDWAIVNSGTLVLTNGTIVAAGGLVTNALEGAALFVETGFVGTVGDGKAAFATVDGATVTVNDGDFSVEIPVAFIADGLACYKKDNDRYGIKTAEKVAEDVMENVTTNTGLEETAALTNGLAKAISGGYVSAKEIAEAQNVETLLKNKTAANGATVLEDLALGLDPSDANAMPKVTPKRDVDKTDTAHIVLAAPQVDVNPGYTVTYQLMKHNGTEYVAEGEPFASDKDIKIPVGSGRYRVDAHVEKNNN